MRELPDSHQFASLSQGACHFCLDGPADGALVLLAHGATVPAWEFDRLAPILHRAGLRTIRADFYGHGYSDRPRVDYTPELFVDQLLELLDHLGVHEPVDVLGHSLGASVAARLAVSAPGRVRRLVLAAPLVNFVANLGAARLLSLPGMGELLTRGYVVPMLVRRRARLYRDIADGRFAQRFRTQLIKPGFDRALLSMFRSGTLGDQSRAYAALSTKHHPVLLMRGGADDILPRYQLDAVRRLLPQARYREIEDARHSFLLSHPERVAPEVIEFLLAP